MSDLNKGRIFVAKWGVRLCEWKITSEVIVDAFGREFVWATCTAILIKDKRVENRGSKPRRPVVWHLDKIPKPESQEANR
jgi:hypothetical protein